ncbi:hypothetical protein E4U41_003030, partial [Claviceps citrina]
MPSSTAKPNRAFTPRKPAAAASSSLAKAKAKKQAKPNASILSFFQKTQRPEESLFVGAAVAAAAQVGLRDGDEEEDNIYDDDGDDGVHRFNESGLPHKKRRFGDESLTTRMTTRRHGGSIDDGVVVVESGAIKTAKMRLNVPFVLDSESEDEDDDAKLDDLHPNETELEEKLGETDDLDPDEFQGEEMRERRFMREQARLEAEEAGAAMPEELDLFMGDDSFQDDSAAAQCCPVCNGSLRNVSMDEATRHVNSCLDGNPIPLPAVEVEVEAMEMSKRFARAAVPRPGQPNPLELDQNSDSGGHDQDGKEAASKSAFSRLMSNKAEDSAWAVAAAAENASRGRRAYERRCPFYKMIPGFNICVDAFRYGAVEGCEAYFLSHFHSDHYIGLTARWEHGPIYCSRVTGSLVRKQLRTAAKWVVELEFEKCYDVPGTGGATVTMIPANHCPGSSLFLFHKATGQNRRGKRVLHCGDFRACPAHVRHPLLRPDVRDAATGRLGEQVIDICYLDTTYLNPKYSFPPQDDVVKACADLCASLSPDPESKDDDGDFWEKRAREKGTQAVSTYFARAKQQSGDQSGDGDGKAEQPRQPRQPRLGQRLLVVCGTYSIGKERICIAVAKALRTKIFANPGKMRICKQLDDAELAALLTSDPVEAQVHMQALAEIRAETLQEYLNGLKPHFSRVVGFRPTGWTFRPAGAAGA